MKHETLRKEPLVSEIVRKAQRTGRWAITMTRWAIKRLGVKKEWRLITFPGKGKGESVGVVDILAMRKDHRKDNADYQSGDLLEIILIQVKGGKSKWPSWQDVARLRKVKSYYHAKDVLLARWLKGSQPKFYALSRCRDISQSPKEAWKELDKPADVRAVFQ